jgi:hypothetical protein
VSAKTAGTIGTASPLDKSDLWERLAAPIPPEEIQWRQDGRPAARDGKFFARFVAFIDAQFVQSRFDDVVPGEWDLTLELLPPAVTSEGEEVEPFSFKARIQVLGVIREDVGSGKDYKTASTDAFKRAAVRFGVARELYAMRPNFVQVDGDGKYAKPLEDPAVAYARRHGKGGQGATRPTLSSATSGSSSRETDGSPAAASTEPSSTSATSSTDAGPLALDEQSCPKCGGRMWDNRLTKRNPKAPDFKCKDRACDGVIWPPKGEKSATREEQGRAPEDEAPAPDDADFLPF